jgi:hypothetical protein
LSEVKSVLRVRPNFSSVAAGARASARKFSGYTQYRDQHPDSELAQDVGGLVGYMRFRDATSQRGRMFDATGVAGSADRDALVEFVDESFAGIHREGKRSSTNNLAYYDFIISPQDSRDLDLKALTRATMAQLGRDAGTGGLPPWIAAEHRNTQHPHVHVVLAGIRRLQSGRHRTLLIPPPRLTGMTAAMNNEIDRQRDARGLTRDRAVKTLGAPGMSSRGTRIAEREPGTELRVDRSVGKPPESVVTQRLARANRALTPRTTGAMGRLAGRLASHYRREMERAIREQKWSSERDWCEMEMSL